MNDLTPNERDIIEIVRDLRPYEEVKIVKDASGRIDHYFIVRTQKVVMKGSRGYPHLTGDENE